MRFVATPRTAGPLFEEEVRGRAYLVNAEGERVGEFDFEADCEFTDLVVKASEMTIYPAFRGRGYARRFLSAFFRYLQREARRRGEEIVVNGEITSKTILHIWQRAADDLLFATELHDHTRRATNVHLVGAPACRAARRSRLIEALPELGAQDKRGFLKKPCVSVVGIASLIDPDL